MKKHHISYLLALAVLAPVTASAQKIDPTLEVTREFDGSFMSVHKSRLDSSINDSLLRYIPDFKYTIFEKPYRNNEKFIPSPAMELASELNEASYNFSANIEGLYPAEGKAGIFYSPLHNPGNTMSFYGSFDYFNAKIPVQKINAENESERDFDNKQWGNYRTALGGMQYLHGWESGTLSINTSYDNNMYFFRGMPDDEMPHTYDRQYVKDHFSHTFNRFCAGGSIKSHDTDNYTGRFGYSTNIFYQNTCDRFGDGIIAAGNENRITENLFRLSGKISPSFGRYRKFSLGFNWENVNYGGIKDYSYGIFGITPQYAFSYDRLNFLLGFKLSGRYKNLDNTDKYHRNIFPEIKIDVELIKNKLWFYTGATGKNTVNSYSSILSQFKYSDPRGELMASSIPLDFRTGIKTSIYGNFTADVYWRYTMYHGLQQFISSNSDDSGISATETYSNHNETAFGIKIAAASGNFSGKAGMEYGTYTKGKKSLTLNGFKPFGFPNFKLYAETGYDWRNLITASVYVEARSKTHSISNEGTEYTIKPFANLGINVKYAVNKNFKIYLRLSNILNEHMQYYAGYIEKGTSAAVGLLVKF
ncbi:MAG: hypothetical protein LKI53_04805 [Bacteroidales bacterium]|nr:hypothetical protein [Bacteroidales bacterium]